MRTAIVSTYPPRACGIGTFAADLRGTLLGLPDIKGADLVAVVNEPSSPQRRGLLATIAQSVRGDYVRTARMLGRLDVDVVLLQHEYGIFGGRDGEYVLSFAEALAQPLVVTLHTVLSQPTPHQADVLTELCAQAELVIVMTDTARRLLVESGACPEEKVRVVPHGAPTRLTLRAADDLDGRTGAAYRRGGDRFLISTMYPTIARDLHLGYGDIGTITGALAIAWGVAALIMGNLSDRIGQRRVLVASLVAFSLLIGASGLAAGLTGLVLVRLVMGFADGAFTPSSIAAAILSATFIPDKFNPR